MNTLLNIVVIKELQLEIMNQYRKKEDKMNYYEEIKNKIIDNEIYSKVKDYSKERNTVNTYFEIGRLLTEAGGKYGDNIIDEYSKRLVVEVGKKYNSRTLRRIKQYYKTFSDEKWSTVSTKLTWSQYVELLPIKNENKLWYYLNICIKYNIGVRELRYRIRSKEYERLSESAKIKFIENEQPSLPDLVKNPILIKNTNKYTEISEKVLQQIILEDIKNFMQELGTGFCFISNEYPIKIGNNYNYIDLLLYNIEFNCYIVIELKVTKLKKEHIGQIEVYMNYIDKNLKKVNQDKTIGIIICKKNNEYIIEYCSDKRIITREFELVQKEGQNELLRRNKKVKNHLINRKDLETYYNVGKMLNEARKHYGQKIISEDFKKLTNELGKGYSKRNLWLMLKYFFI